MKEIKKVRRVKFYKYRYNQQTHKTDRCVEGEGIFHQFGVDYEEYDTGPGNYSTAIIENSDGKLHNIHVGLVEFLE